ncbi:MAG: acyl-ACP--UDP-N-acetylglucosamine O-acyltransferase [Verrucomicrobia bacterium]|nr:acyl-ACP--UDP-N-acetylglucosamine O-acyltransferase [Verrucomicrobiota bacterium]
MSTKKPLIHPTAVIHPTAKIGSGCEVGPYCVIGEYVELGEKCKLHSHIVIDGHTSLGRENDIYPFCSIGLGAQDTKVKSGINRTVIGSHNIFREYVSIHGPGGEGGYTRIGSHNHILAYGHIAHNVQLGDRITMINVATLGGHVIVEDCAVIGGLAAVHQHCRVGTMSMIGGCSKVVQDIPPYMICDGSPAGSRTINKVGLERNGVSEETQNVLKKAYKILFRGDLGGTNALAKIEKDLPQLPEVKHLVQFVRASERGISKCK